MRAFPASGLGLGTIISTTVDCAFRFLRSHRFRANVHRDLYVLLRTEFSVRARLRPVAVCFAKAGQIFTTHKNCFPAQLTSALQLSYFAMQSLNRMNSLNKALSEISSIRRQVAHSTEFRGYGPATLAGTGILAFAAAGAQAVRLPDPANHMPRYLSIWVIAAALSATMIGIEMYARTRRIHSGMADEMIRVAVEQFLPSVGAGALITLALVRYVPAVLWMLPGLWQIVFSLGVFSSCRFLPRAVAAVGAWYLLTGLTCIALGDSRALSPWAMGFPYGVGQLLVAGILLVTRKEEEE